MNIQVCRDPSDAVALYLPQRLYVKSFAKLNISVQLPSHKVHGKSISNWELMEKLRKMILPDSFSMLKVSKHSSEVIRFDAELESRDKLERVLTRLEDRVVQLKEYPDQLKIRVSEAKSDFPSRHDWDSFFRDATDMDEMKPGERPDTIHITNLPLAWFIHEKDKDEDALPSESIFKKVFEKFGAVRQVDVPAADPYRMQMKSTMRGITTTPQDASLYFEGYVQFNEYVSFVRCMDALRGRKLLRKRDDIAEWCGITVQFDKTKHMTDAAVKRRAIVRERLSARQRAKDEEEKAEKEKAAKREVKERQKYEHMEREKLEKMREREERRKKKQLAKLMERDNVDLNSKVAEEQRKLMKAQKKLQAIRLIEELFRRIELRPELQRNGARSSQHYMPGERVARTRIIDKFKRQQEDVLEEQRNQLRNALNGRIVIRSALETKKPKRDSSIDSISSEDRRTDKHKRIKTEKLTTPEREIEYNKATSAGAAGGMYGLPYGFGYPFTCPPGYGYPPQTSLYYPLRGAYYPPPGEYRARYRGAHTRGRPRPPRHTRMPYFDGPDASHQYYKYFKKLTESESRNDNADRARSRSRSHSRSRSRSRRRSYSRSRSRRRSYSRSRSRSRRSRSRSRSRRSRSRSRRSRSYHSRSRSRSHRRSRSRARRSRSASKRHSPGHTPPGKDTTSADVSKRPADNTRERSRSWSLPKEPAEKAWSKSPKEKNE